MLFLFYYFPRSESQLVHHVSVCRDGSNDDEFVFFGIYLGIGKNIIATSRASERASEKTFTRFEFLLGISLFLFLG